MDTVTRCGFVALCGKPNVGKSTLFNRLVQAPLAAATGKPQTTRHNIKGVLTEGTTQFVFVDTPGIYSRSNRRLSRLLNANAREALSQIDVALLVVEAGVWNERDAHILQDVRASQAPVVLAANKIDRIGDHTQLLPYFAELAEYKFAEYVPISARTGEGCEDLKKTLGNYLPSRGFLFDADTLTDRHERFFMEEAIREQLLVQLGQELPYATHVQVTQVEEHPRRVRVAAEILVERQSQRKILLGRQGSRIRELGRASRLTMERLLDRPVFLKLHVRVHKRWQQDPQVLRSYRGGV